MSANTYSSAAYTPPATGMWKITHGEGVYCDIVDRGRCVTDGPGNYGNNERCEVEALRPLLLTAEQYQIENNYDYVTVAGEQYRYRDNGPKAKFMAPGEKWVWKSDNYITRQGYKLCGHQGTVLLVCVYVCSYVCVCVFKHIYICVST